MRQLELLAPARDAEIGIAAISCGADAVYIAGPQFGARQAAGNDIDEIRRLCGYAHRYGARIFVTLNTILYDEELEDAYRLMLDVQEAGADALIVQDMAVVKMALNGIGDIRKDFHIPLHASTQCAIRTPEQAVFLEGLGFSRLILERELSLEQIRAIRKAVSCELEFFVHGALCVCYSGQCYLSEHIAGRSANRGACIQACRSRYDLTDQSGKVLVRDKALLSLKDFNLSDRLEDLAEAGITSFKIEGRLKNASYVKNIARHYSKALDKLVKKHPLTYERGSFGHVRNGFTPAPEKTFNRGYTQLYLDGKKGRWAAMDAAKSMGEEIGEVISINREKTSLTIRPVKQGIRLSNGDGFSFVNRDGDVTGFRGDVCDGNTIRFKETPSIFKGARLFRNIDSLFEKEIENSPCIREIGATISLEITRKDAEWELTARAESEDGRRVSTSTLFTADPARNRERMEEIIAGQICKSTGIYIFSLGTLPSDGDLPFMSAAFINSIRRDLAQKLDGMPCISKPLLKRELKEESEYHTLQKILTYKSNISNRLSEELYIGSGAESTENAYEIEPVRNAELMRSRYCIRFELGMCPVHQHAKDSGPLFLVNNGRRLALRFDCRNCEMTVSLP